MAIKCYHVAYSFDAVIVVDTDHESDYQVAAQVVREVVADTPVESAINEITEIVDVSMLEDLTAYDADSNAYCSARTARVLGVRTLGEILPENIDDLSVNDKRCAFTKDMFPDG